MINLLSDDKKKEIRAGRANTIILGYIFMTIVALVLLGGVSAGTYVTLSMTRADAQERVTENEEKIAQYKPVQTSAESFRNDLSTAKQIMDKEITYSSLIVKIAQAVPSGVILDSLSLSPETIGVPITIKAEAKNDSAALALKTNFEKQTDLFSDVHFDDITYATGTTPTDYPVSITLALTINKKAIQQ